MKKFMLSLALVCATLSAYATQYSVEVNVSTQQVAIWKDGKLVKGKAQTSASPLAVVELDKNQSDVYASLKTIKGVSAPDMGACRVQKDGTATFYGITVQDNRIRTAYREAKAYLDKTDQPILVTLVSE